MLHAACSCKKPANFMRVRACPKLSKSNQIVKSVSEKSQLAARLAHTLQKKKTELEYSAEYICYMCYMAPFIHRFLYQLAEKKLD